MKIDLMSSLGVIAPSISHVNSDGSITFIIDWTALEHSWTVVYDSKARPPALNSRARLDHMTDKQQEPVVCGDDGWSTTTTILCQCGEMLDGAEVVRRELRPGTWIEHCPKCDAELGEMTYYYDEPLG